MIAALARKYAQALATVALEKGAELRAQEQLTLFAETLAGHAELRETLNNPVIPFSAKRGIVERLGQEIPLDPIIVNFLLVILENNRMRQFDEFLAAFREVLDEHQGVVRGDVRAAARLDDSERVELEAAVAKAVGKKVELNYQTDASLIGGLKLRVGSTIFDGSIRTQLETIRARLASQ